MHITLPYPPSANRYWRNFRGRMVVSPEARLYKEHVGALCATEQLQPLDGEVSVVLRFYRPRKVGDLDNLIKVTLDSLRGWAYVDDDQVVHIDAARGDDKANPRVEVWVSAVTE